MTAINKWNNKKYRLVETKEKSVILEREDGSRFEVSKAEFNFAYRMEKCKRFQQSL